MHSAYYGCDDLHGHDALQSSQKLLPRLNLLCPGRGPLLLGCLQTLHPDGLGALAVDSDPSGHWNALLSRGKCLLQKCRESKHKNEYLFIPRTLPLFSRM